MTADPDVRILPDPAQIDAADPRQSVFVTANAGSGKTSTLVDRVARLLLAKVEAAEILCVTYTKAAAAEMQARLYQRLGAWAVADDETLRRSLADLDGRDPDRLSAADLRQSRKLFAQALDTPGGLKIQTLHAFCEKLLRRFPLEAGVTPGFKVLEDQAAVALSHAAREDLARLALADPESKVGRAYAHFAVALAYADFEALLNTLEQDRAKLTDYVARVAEGRPPGPHVLAGADPERDVETIEAEFMRFLDRDAWRDQRRQMRRPHAFRRLDLRRRQRGLPDPGGSAGEDDGDLQGPRLRPRLADDAPDQGPGCAGRGPEGPPGRGHRARPDPRPGPRPSL
jgi:ATP-dependent helicase/nuclease subunit A